jgi:hypothetical protein
MEKLKINFPRQNPSFSQKTVTRPSADTLPSSRLWKISYGGQCQDCPVETHQVRLDAIAGHRKYVAGPTGLVRSAEPAAVQLQHRNIRFTVNVSNCLHAVIKNLPI